MRTIEGFMIKVSCSRCGTYLYTHDDIRGLRQELELFPLVCGKCGFNERIKARTVHRRILDGAMVEA